MYELEVSTKPGSTLRAAPLASAQDVVDWATDALAGVGLRIPDDLADGSFAAQVAATGEYSCDVDWARVTVKRTR